MSLRRSTRVQARSTPPKVLNGVSVEAAGLPSPLATFQQPQAQSNGKGPTKKRTQDALLPPIQNGSGNAAVLPAVLFEPQTPSNKRHRIGKNKWSRGPPPPVTPTPSAIGLMTSPGVSRRHYSSGDIDDATPPPPSDRPAEPHHTNAILVTPHGTQVQPSYRTFDESPSKLGPTTTSSTTLLSEACAHLIRVDPTLRPLIESHHCTPFSPEGLAETIDPFRSLATGIISQQVSGAAAKSIKNKFIGLFPVDACPTGFPPPPLVAATPLPRLREAGLSQRKAEYIQGLAEKFANGELTVDKLMRGSDEEVMESLVAVRGLGRWSVEMFMCFGLKRLDVFSTGDLGIQRGMAAYAGRDVAKLKGKGGGKWKYMTEQDMLANSEPFRPYRSLFMWYMWRIEDVDVSAMQDN